MSASGACRWGRRPGRSGMGPTGADRQRTTTTRAAVDTDRASSCTTAARRPGDRGTSRAAPLRPAWPSTARGSPPARPRRPRRPAARTPSPGTSRLSDPPSIPPGRYGDSRTRPVAHKACPTIDLLAFADGPGPAAAPHAAERGAGEAGALQATVEALGLLPREQDLRGSAGFHGQGRADGDSAAKAGEPLGGGRADAILALAAGELSAPTGDITQVGQGRAAAATSPARPAGRPPRRRGSRWPCRARRRRSCFS